MDPVAAGEGRYGEADPSGGRTGLQRPPSAGETVTHPPRRGDKDHGPGRCGEANPSGGCMGQQHPPSVGETGTHPPRQGDKDHGPTSPPLQTIKGLLAAAVGR
jgi:hypothetical protein